MRKKQKYFSALRSESPTAALKTVQTVREKPAPFWKEKRKNDRPQINDIII